jgi:hypothetical protein
MLPYSFGPVEFNADAGGPTIVELRVPSRGFINTMRLNQIGGGAEGGRFRIFQSLEAAQAMAGSSNSDSLTGVDPDDYSVVGVKTITAGAFAEYGGSYPYSNKDANQSSRKRRLWLVIEPTGAGSNSYSLSMEISEPVTARY